MREPGAVLDGKYEIVQRLGSGGMGEVHLVRHLHLQELRVVKILRQDLAADPTAQARFLREARLATQIKHPNVAILYDFSQLPDGSFFMVWEHIEGQDVGDRLRQGPFPVPVALQLGIQTLRGLEAIHATGVIHRDLSPDNLMITEDRRGQTRVKIIDLGLAKNLGPDPGSFEITQVGMFMGKLQYCSPEQAATGSGTSGAGGEALDRRSDLYSFALVLYEMLVGLPPWDSESSHGFIFKRLSEDPLPLVGRNPAVQIPAELDRVVRRGLERDRDKRFPDAVTFIQALERVALSLAAVETQEIPMPARPAGPAPAPRQRSSSELTKEEKLELLAQIERAGQRQREASKPAVRLAPPAVQPEPPASQAEQLAAGAEEALAAGRVAEARERVAQLEAADPRTPAAGQLRSRLQQIEQQEDRHRRAAEAEQVLAGYLQKKQLPLARLAVETLLELAPAHPRRAEYEAALATLAREVEQEKLADKALAAAREALARGDLKATRRELEVVVKDDLKGERAAALRAEIAAAERGQRQASELEERRRRLEEQLAGRRVAEAERELQELSRLDVTRVTMDFYRARLDEVRSQADAKERLVELERRYKLLRDAEDWFGAREIAREAAAGLPGHPRPAEMFAEIERLESEHRRRQAIEQGVRQIEEFIGKRDAAKAELALRVLLQMDPDNRHRKRLEKQIRGLRSPSPGRG